MAKKYEELTFNDDFMFCRILEEKPALCRELLELVLDHKVGELVSVNPQKPIEITANGKGVRFDVYAEGSDSEIYDIEMQNASVDSIAKRSRYSQGMIDLNLIKRGSHYSELNRSYVIYICRFNIFKEGELHKYSFRNLCVMKPKRYSCVQKEPRMMFQRKCRHSCVILPQVHPATVSQTSWKTR